MNKKYVCDREIRKIPNDSSDAYIIEKIYGNSESGKNYAISYIYRKLALYYLNICPEICLNIIKDNLLQNNTLKVELIYKDNKENDLLNLGDVTIAAKFRRVYNDEHLYLDDVFINQIPGFEIKEF